MAFVNFQKKPASLFASANRELTSNPLEFIEKLLSDDQREKSCNEMIFGSRESVKKFIESESEDHSSSSWNRMFEFLCFPVAQRQQLKANSQVVLPQLDDALKSDILERIAAKTLTEVHVAVAPSVSFE
jgi:hypothetical protein